MSASYSDIVRIAGRGALNAVNDEVIGGVFAGSPDLGGSGDAGQLGKIFTVGADSIAALTYTTTGTLYAGSYQYVRRRATDDDSPALAAGKLAFWDLTVASYQSAYQVTTDEDLSSSGNVATMIAGVFLNNIEPGNYGFIQILGIVYVRYRSVLTVAVTAGSRVYATGAGDTGSDQGTVDGLTTDSTSLANARYLGLAFESATGGTLKRIDLQRTVPLL